MSDIFSGYARSVDGPFVNLYRVTPNDEELLPIPARKLKIGAGVDAAPKVRVTPAGMPLDEYIDVPWWVLDENVIILKVWATGSTTNEIWALV